WFGSAEPMKSDIHHLFPTHGSVNSARSNHPFDEIPDASTDNWYGVNGSSYTSSSSTPSSNIDHWSERDGSIFEPREDHKGNLARAIFYYYTMYPNTAGSLSSIVASGDINVLYQWHLADPVDATEMTRNNRTAEKQGNRNPYIDYPDLAARAWGFTPVGGGNPPAAPTASIATNTSSIAVSWTNVSNETGYKVFRSTNASTYSQVVSLGANVTSYSDHSVSAGTTYYYYVMAFNGDGDSNASNIVNGSPTGSGGGGGGAATELFFSEYIEGSSNNKALEIANFTGSSVNLNGYTIQKQTNGSGSWGSSYALSGTLANGDVFVIANSSATSAVTAQADVTTGSGAVTFNGNDPVALFKNGTLIDVIGNFNGGSTNFAQNRTLVRNATVNSPNTTYITSEWTVNAQDDFSNLGSHTMNGGGGNPDPCDTPTGLASSSITTSSFVLSWNAVSGASTYQVELNGSVVATISGTSYTVTGLNASTTYACRVRTNCSSDNSGYTSTLNVTTDAAAPTWTCSSTVAAFPYNESFESGVGAWEQGSGDDRNWTRDSNGTPSSGTGPASGSNGSWYMYLETSGNGTGYPNKTAYFNSPCFDLSGESDIDFNFDYHMNGTAMGSLVLQATNNNGTTWTNIWSISGSQGSAWRSATVDMASYLGGLVKLRFLATSGSGWSSDIAIDNIQVSSGNTGGGSPGGTTAVTLTLVTDNYGSETSWTLRNASGTTVASGSGYGNNQTITETFDLADGCYDFTINDSYGDGICCSYGNGSYALTSGGSTLASGGSFGSTETRSICVDSGARIAINEANISTPDFRDGVELVIYPNPVSSVLTININSGPSKAYVYSVSGQLIATAQISKENRAVDVSALNSGIYILKLVNENGSFAKRFVKE
ncbi:MAG: endonuclease, partial [Flammeovirgaceae bacterium]